ncbi:glycosyltransferase [Pseudomonas sp. CC6-YY-74]|uniref:glycosyltransferase n=1 Tax=Pseudomonas sp. CC6-YY-74 TaxID=1930532 RepID=UPI0009A15897|nr:hypothetical protein [Pseudomonas sp. CC6-YY-74]
MRVLLTGPSGFVGRALLKRLCDAQGITPVARLRRADALGGLGRACECLLLGDFAVMSTAASVLALRQAMQTLWDYPTQPEAMGRRAALRADALFSAEAMVASYAGLYRSLL